MSTGKTMLFILTISLIAQSANIPENKYKSEYRHRYHLVRPDYYHQESEMTGGMNCTHQCDCASNVCDEGICLCYNNQGSPDCSYERSNKAIYILLFCVGALFPFGPIIMYFVIGKPHVAIMITWVYTMLSAYLSLQTYWSKTADINQREFTKLDENGNVIVLNRRRSIETFAIILFIIPHILTFARGIWFWISGVDENGYGFI